MFEVPANLLLEFWSMQKYKLICTPHPYSTVNEVEKCKYYII